MVGLMPRIAKELSAIEVKRLVEPGLHAVGGVTGLALNVNVNGARSWILRVSINSKRKEIGLGSFPTVSLADARELGRKFKLQIAEGINPLVKKEQQRELERKKQLNLTTFDQAFERFFIEKRAAELANEKHKKQWRSTIGIYASPVIGQLHLAEIGQDQILRVLKPIWEVKTETASRLRGRIENILDWATVSGLREGENPARWKGNLDQLLPSPTRLKKSGHWPAVALDEISTWYDCLQGREGIAARALEFLTLTAARSGEIRLAVWDEIDVQQRIWIIPAARMKAKREHRVPLSDAAIAVLDSTPRMLDVPYIFPSPRNMTLSDMTLSAVMRRINEKEIKAGRAGFNDSRTQQAAVPHGLRSTFRDWAAEKTQYPSEMAEMALAHGVGTNVEKAYRRTDLLEKRREMMHEWALFVT